MGDAVDDRSFDVRLTDAGRSVTARVFVDERGAPYDFSTTDRFADLPGGPVRAEWRTPVRGWEHIDGRSVPGPIGSCLAPTRRTLPYVNGRLSDISRNVLPGRTSSESEPAR